MQPKQLGQLQDAIQKFLDKFVETDVWPNMWTPENLALNMAKAAELVFDATADASKFAEEQEKS